MNEKIVEMLHLSLEPVGIFLGNTSAICELEASPQKRNCVIPFVLAAAKGKMCGLYSRCLCCRMDRRFGHDRTGNHNSCNTACDRIFNLVPVHEILPCRSEKNE